MQVPSAQWLRIFLASGQRPARGDPPPPLSGFGHMLGLATSSSNKDFAVTCDPHLMQRTAVPGRPISVYSHYDAEQLTTLNSLMLNLNPMP